ncbi:heme ABC transporter ATP-binding protein [Lunatimonas salinarum]|uniref:heme ABC transporter ATP-binding protein n=1 Tax=Lunatimonas salinarum TaxID=1774590 RepID=UPI001AE01253|nr:heme ABC transporter ATP-binding protein [Lunatimonas salinarum]
MLEAKKLHFCIKKKPILDQASICIKSGELTALIGPNGAGKSTLFKLLSGEARCQLGSISYNRHPIETLKSNQLATLRAVMPQHSSVTFPFRALEVVELGLVLSKQSFASSTIQKVMKATSTWHLRDQLVDNLSGGERQRVQLARVLAQIWEPKPFPRYLLLDEPTSSMDIAQQHHVLQVVSQLKHKNIGILAILHDLNLAANYSDAVVLLKEGVVVKQGPTRKILTPENLEQVFDYPIQVSAKEPHQPIFISSLPTNKTAPMYNYKLA